jgi:hypothetical protein
MGTAKLSIVGLQDLTYAGPFHFEITVAPYRTARDRFLTSVTRRWRYQDRNELPELGGIKIGDGQNTIPACSQWIRL